ncbi:MAG: MBL fold metallo-hydrolase [Candidatus Limnocylindrales bacterium]
MPDRVSMRLTVVGCAAAWSRVPGRASSSYLVELAGPADLVAPTAASPLGDPPSPLGDLAAPGHPQAPAILLDMGQGSFSALSRYRDPATLGGVLISHAHPDHCVDLVPLRLYLRYGCEPARTVTLRGPAELRQRFDGLTNEPDFLCDLPGDPLAPGTFELAGFEVSVAPVLHKETSFAFRVAPSRHGPTGAPGLVYSGDCGRADDLLALIQPGDTLLVEASHGAGPIIEGPNHLNAAEAARAAAAGRAGRLVLTHLFDDVDPQEALALARSKFAGETLLAEPGLRIAF